MRFRSNSFAISLAILAWWASVFLPLAHGSMAVAHGADDSRWCGARSDALIAAYSALPADVRSAIERSSGDAADAVPDCSRACGVAMQLAASPASLLPSLPLPSAGPPSPVRAGVDDDRPARTPPARGPPAIR